MKTLQRVVAEYEWLTYRGWGGEYHLREQLMSAVGGFASAATWVEQHMRKQTQLNQRRSSYGLKHICERMVGQYISNGVMIAAFLAHEYQFNRIRASWNVEFNVSECAVQIAEDIVNGRQPRGFVYFIRAEKGAFKVGMTLGLPVDRLAQLQTASPVPLSLHKWVKSSNPKALETRLHQYFAKQRVKGEWFNVTPGMIEDALEDIQYYE